MIGVFAVALVVVGAAVWGWAIRKTDMAMPFGWLLLLALVLFIVYEAGMQAAPYQGCDGCLSQGNSWWWCAAVYGLGCL